MKKKEKKALEHKEKLLVFLFLPSVEPVELSLGGLDLGLLGLLL